MTEKGIDCGNSVHGNKNIIIASVCAALIAVVAICAWVYSIINKADKDYSAYPTVYCRDDGSWMARPDGADKSIKLGDNISGIGVIRFSTDGKYIYFLDGGDLYFVNTLDGSRKKLGESISIIEGIHYEVIGDTKNVLYKTDDDALYFNNLEENIMIAQDVDSYMADANGKKVLYLDKKGNLFLNDVNKDEQKKLDNGVTSLVYGMNSLDDVFYMKDSTLYVSDSGKSAKLGDDFAYATVISDVLYATKENERICSYDEIINDDLTSQLRIEEQLYLKEPIPEEYTTSDEYDAAYRSWRARYSGRYKRLSDDVLAAFEIYDEIVRLKRYFAEDRPAISTYELYMYNNGKLQKTEECIGNMVPGIPDDGTNNLLVYDRLTENMDFKINLSECKDSVSSLRYDLSYQYLSASPKEKVLVRKGKVIGSFDADKVSMLRVSKDGKYLYVQGAMQDNCFDVERYKLGRRSIKDRRTVLRDVAFFQVYNDSVVARDKDGSLAAFADDKEVNIDAQVGFFQCYDGNIYYLADYDESTLSSKLMVFDGKESRMISDFAGNAFAVYGEDKIVYTKNMSNPSGGTLCISDSKGNSREIDDEVRDFIVFG